MRKLGETGLHEIKVSETLLGDFELEEVFAVRDCFGGWRIRKVTTELESPDITYESVEDAIKAARSVTSNGDRIDFDLIGNFTDECGRTIGVYAYSAGDEWGTEVQCRMEAMTVEEPGVFDSSEEAREVMASRLGSARNNYESVGRAEKASV